MKQNYRKCVNKAKRKYNTDLIETSKNKCKAAWNVIKQNGNVCSIVAIDHNITPDSFNNFFLRSVDSIKQQIGVPLHSPKDLIQPIKLSTPPEQLIWNTITPNSVINATKRLKISDSNDVYLMSNNLLKKIIGNIVDPLSYLFNLCLLEGVFPNELKVSRICPIFKKGPRHKPESYRPISIIPVISKLFQLLIFDQLSTFFENNNLLSLSQFGFRKGKSTTNAIDKVVLEVLSVFENKVFAQATLCDLSKAFDCVNHSDLLTKLYYYGVQGSQLAFFKSYLNNRKQKVLVNGDWSHEVEVKYGVPQGSVLGPLLFLICINDLPNFIKCKSFLYADDTTFLNINPDLGQLQDLVQNTLHTASDWFKTNGFLLNEDKTQNIIFTLRSTDANTTLNNCSNEVKFLGMFLDKSLTWGSHIDYISPKLSRVIFLIQRLTNCIETGYIRTAYFSYFQSIFRYGLIFYGNCSRITEILILQKKVIRIISGAGFIDHCKPLFIQLKIQTIINLYVYDLILYTFNNPSIIKHPTHTHNTRSNTNGLATIIFLD